MIRFEDDCCGCANGTYPCLGSSCSLRENPHYYCDKCGEERELYEFDDERQLCETCLLEEFKRVEGSY